MPASGTGRTILVTSAPTMEGALLLAADYPFLDVLWTMFIFFAWVIWIWLLILVLTDNFRRRDHSGWAKAGWTLFVIFLPLLGVLVYMIVRPPADEVLGAPAR
jgi:Phospholipase_D-nuclease N-terminal